MLLKLKHFFLILIIIPCIAFGIELQVDINGVTPALLANIKTDLNLQQATTEEKLTSGRIQNLYQLAEGQITATLQAKGYYNSNITSDLKLIPAATPEQDKWIATFNIKLGLPTKINKIILQAEGPGKNNRKIKALLTTHKLIVKRTLVHENYEEAKEEILSNFNAVGYLQAEFTKHAIEINRDAATADIILIINTGPQYTFGKITFIDSVYPNDFLIRFAPFKPGDPYDLQKLMDFQNNLESVDLFNKVRFYPMNDLHDPNDIVVPIEVRLALKPKNRYTGSVGYGTDTGFRGNLGWMHRRTSTPGHKIFSNIYASQVRSNARVSYIIPGSQPATDKYVLGALGQIESFEEVYSRKAEISASKIIKRNKLESMYGLWYFTETFRVVHNTPLQNKKYLLPTAKWIWIDSKPTDSFEFGTRLDLKIRVGAHFALSDNNIAEIEVNGKKIFLATKNMRFLFRTTLGAVASKSFTALPPSLRFFTGGEDTVRGYKYNSLGPLAVPGDQDSNTGGRYLFIGSGEVEHRLYKDLSGVLFFDAGNAALTTKIPLAYGAGFGIRYKTPIGNLRFDLAKPLNNIVTKKYWHIHVNFGMDL